ncbi:MAG TPA: carboxypeptidase regulatory-like domain-containing protein [Candidatus Sulfotelmatobacter sp.]|nr:carboxypeptidase regulatory-like domain-containing protein [Candidatus Sulfotelmatobacter sp.]
MPGRTFCFLTREGRGAARNAAHFYENAAGWFAFVAIVALTTFAFSSFAVGQATTGSIHGQIIDPSKALVVGAKVTALNMATGVAYPGTSDNQGNYVILNLLPGVYNVTVEKEGFNAATVKDARIVIDQKQLINFQLKVGGGATVETVTAAPTLLQTEGNETGDVIQSQDILNLPLLGRDFTALVGLSAGVTSAGGSINSFSYSISGQREYANSIQIDGVESTSNRSGDLVDRPSVDAVEEFKVSTSGFDAEFGRSAGGVVSIQTKGGTNKFHGSAYEFFRPNFTTAKSYGFDGEYVPPSILKQHNYGGTFGGPIVKDKTFFFVSYEGLYSAQSYNYVYAVPPISQIIQNPDGSIDLTHLVDPDSGQQIPIYDPIVSSSCYGGCYQQISYLGVNNVIPPDRVSQAGLATLLNFFPKPNLTGDHNGWYHNFAVNSPVTDHAKTADARLDQHFSNKDNLSFVFHYNNSDDLVTDPFHGATPVPGAGDADQANNQTDDDQGFSISETHLFSNRVVNEFRVGYTRFSLAQYSLLDGHDYSTQFGMANIAVPGFSSTDAYPYIYLGAGYLTGGSTYKPLYFKDRNWQFADNVTLSGLGRHTFKFGADFRRLVSNPNFSLFPTGYQYYGGAYLSMTSDWSYTSPLDDFSGATLYGTGGNDIADLLLGLPLDHYMGLQLTNPVTHSWEMDYFAQDTYKVTPRLTLNYGIRYEFQAPYTEEHDLASNYVPNPSDPTTGGTILLAGRGGNSRSLVNARWNQFAPRFGLAFQIDPKTVLRGGWGLFYSPENDAREDLLTKNLPFAIQQAWNNIPYNGPCFTTCDGTYFYQIDQAFPRISSPPIPSGASSIPSVDVPTLIPNGNSEQTFYVNPNMKTGYSESFNLALQREIGSNFTVEAAFVASRGHRLSYEVGDLNIDPATQADGLIDVNLGQIQGLTDVGFNNYNSLQVKVTKRVSQNLNFLVNWTYAHALDNGPAPFDLGHINSDTPQNAYDLDAEYASGDFDIRHSVKFSGLYHLPFGRGQMFFGNAGHLADLAVGGWQLNGILGMHTGTPGNVTTNGGVQACPGMRPNLVGDPILSRDKRTLEEYFNIAAFVAPTGGQCIPGDTPRNILRGPGYINADVSLFKDFAITEGIKLQTRFEFFNATNTPHFANPNADLGSPTTFGSITRQAGTGEDNRIVQFAAKIVF